MTFVDIAAVNNITVTLLPGTVEEEGQLTGYAIVNVTSATNNQIQLAITLSGAASLPVATNPDANANMTILQLI